VNSKSDSTCEPWAATVSLETNHPPLEQTPDEVMASAYEELRQNLAQELLERIKTASPGFFERLTIELLLGATHAEETSA
jgi:restriction endonuclease Mrr